MRLAIAVAALLLGTTFAPPGLYKDRPAPADPWVDLRPVPLSEEDPGLRNLGDLIYAGGWSIRSNHPRFGGISALHVEGRDVLSLSDSGSVLSFRLPTGGGRRRVTVQRLLEGPGRVERMVNRDTEALAVHDGFAWIAFETRNAVWRYNLRGWRSDSGVAPSAMSGWGVNKGAEAMLRLPDGRFLVFSEAEWLPGGTSEVLLFEGDPSVAETKSVSLRYRPPSGYRITDAALLPDGRVLFLNRRLALWGFKAKLTLGTLPKLAAGAILSGREIGHLERPLTVDNMEALSISQEGGRTMLWMASDDNFSPLQRTLLLRFELTF